LFRVFNSDICLNIKKQNKKMSKENIQPDFDKEPAIDAALIIKYIRNQTDAEETRQVETWINESEDNKKEMKQIAELFFTRYAFDRMASRDVDSAYQTVSQQIRDKSVNNNTHFGYRNLLYIAASLIGAFLLSSAYIYFREKEIIPPKTNYFAVQSNPGVRTLINLSDGTTVYLNSSGKLTYPDHFTGNHREVKLEGEAFFRVKSDPSKPFIVHTNDDKTVVQVTGTEFNVQSFKDDNVFTTTLVEGLVNVTLKRKNGSDTRMKLTSSDKIIFDKNTDSVAIVKTDTEIETAWTKDRLIFRNLPMPQVLKTLAYNYNAEFEIRNPAIYSYRFTGTFQSRQLAQILEYIKISSNIDYTMSFPRSDDSLEIRKTKIILK